MITKVIPVLIMQKFWFFFNLELQLIDAESAIINRLKHLLTEMKGVAFVTALVLEF